MRKGGDSVALNEFLLREAKEKCFEIEIKTVKEFEREKEKWKKVETTRIDNVINTKWKDFLAK